MLVAPKARKQVRADCGSMDRSSMDRAVVSARKPVVVAHLPVVRGSMDRSSTDRAVVLDG